MRKKNNSKKLTTKKIILSIVGVLLTLILIFAGGIFYFLNKVNTVKIDKDNLGVNAEVAQKSKENKITNIALFGIDAPVGQNGRSDAIMILSIDEKNGKLKLSSIMRDSYVDIPGRGKDKINHAYAFGGPELAIQTINNNFDLDIDKFMTVNFTTLPQIIDSIGGVTVNITQAETKYVPGVSAGTQKLNGAQALAYSRIRKDGGDQMRTERQRNVINSLFSTIVKTSPSKYPTLLSELLPLVKTNISSTEFLGLGKDIVDTGATKLIENRFPCDFHRQGKTIKGISYQVFDLFEEKEELHKFIFEN